MTVSKVNLTLRVGGRGGSAWMHRLAAGLLVVSAGCGSEGDANAIKVGAIFDLTGPTADVGTDYADGMRGFVDWINLQGGIEGRPIELIYQD